MAEGGGRRRGGRGGRGRREGGDTTPTQQSEGGASTSHAHHAGTSTQADLPSTPQTQGTEIPSTIASPSQAWLDGLCSAMFQQMIDHILMLGDSGLHGAWWHSYISTRAESILGDAIHGACICADSTRVSCTGRASRSATSTWSGHRVPRCRSCDTACDI
ncbi:hypothetical protein PIB30_051713 [Stylosanthes scabra]|uniref:Uncharacterized protein n=1 Tax=Stylosanthes scabra TaxID=79078 RepID=A0ABU6QIB1_9FABA|nr:hypothetical protein [Stylosanthes scabra]